MVSLAKVISDIKKGMTNLSNVIKNETCSKEYVDQKIAELVNSAPEQLDTLQELSQALNNDKDFAATINNLLAQKLDKAGGTVTGNLTVNGTLNAKATSATKADSATKATTADSATRATKADSATKAGSATKADSATKATTADTATKANSVAYGNVTGKPTLIKVQSWDASTGTLTIANA